MIKQLSENIATITKDYHSDYNGGFVMTSQHVLDWAHQFEEQDREFVLMVYGLYRLTEEAIEIVERR